MRVDTRRRGRRGNQPIARGVDTISKQYRHSEAVSDVEQVDGPAGRTARQHHRTEHHQHDPQHRGTKHGNGREAAGPRAAGSGRTDRGGAADRNPGHGTTHQYNEMTWQ